MLEPSGAGGGWERYDSGIAYWCHVLLSSVSPVYQRLQREIRSKFKTHNDITLSSIGELEYLPAVLDESLRIYPPGTGTHRRVSAEGGAAVCGRYIPGGTIVGINQAFARYRTAL